MANTNLKITGRALTITTDIAVEDMALLNNTYVRKDTEGNEVFGIIYNPKISTAYVSKAGIEFLDVNSQGKLQLTFMLQASTTEGRVAEVKEHFLDIVSELNVCTTLIKEAATAKRAKIADTFDTMEVTE